MTPEEFRDYVEGQFDRHRLEGEQDLNNGEGNPYGRFRAALTISEEMMEHIFDNVDHLQHWCHQYGYRLITGWAARGYRIERDYRAERRIVYNALPPLVLAEDQVLDTAIETETEWQLREIIADRAALELEREFLYGAQGGYVVPDNIAGTIFAMQEEPEEPVDAMAILMEDEDLDWLRLHNPGVLDAGML